MFLKTLSMLYCSNIHCGRINITNKEQQWACPYVLKRSMSKCHFFLCPLQILQTVPFPPTIMLTTDCCHVNNIFLSKVQNTNQITTFIWIYIDTLVEHTWSQMNFVQGIGKSTLDRIARKAPATAEAGES